MLQKFKSRLTEVSEEVKQNPRFQNINSSVTQLVNQSYTALQQQATNNSTPEEPSISYNDLETNMATSNNDHLFSLDDEESSSSPVKNNNVRGRKPSNGSETGLFPIYESPQQMFTLQADQESTAGSEWEESESGLNSVSKEQLFQMLQKSRARYHKYKGRYADVAKAYTDLDNENQKIKNVMQQTQVIILKD